MPDPDFSGGRGRVLIQPRRAGRRSTATTAVPEGAREVPDADPRRASASSSTEEREEMQEPRSSSRVHARARHRHARPGLLGGAAPDAARGRPVRRSGIDPDDPDFQEAQEACESVFEELGGRAGSSSGGRHPRRRRVTR